MRSSALSITWEFWCPGGKCRRINSLNSWEQQCWIFSLPHHSDTLSNLLFPALCLGDWHAWANSTDSLALCFPVGIGPWGSVTSRSEVKRRGGEVIDSPDSSLLGSIGVSFSLSEATFHFRHVYPHVRALSPSSPLCLSPQPSPIKTPFYWPLTAPLTYWDPVAFIDPTCISEKRTFIEPFSNDSTRVCCFPPPPWLVQKPWGPWTCLGLDIWGEEPDFPLMVLIWTLREMWTLFFTRAGKAEHKSHLRLHIYSPLPAREHLENYDVHLWNSVDGRCSKNVPQA